MIIETRKGARCPVAVTGPEDGTPVLFLHGATGPAGGDVALETLGDAGFHVFAPAWPGYADATGEESLHDMLDFALHGWDLADALGLDRPIIAGHGMGGMIAAEMAVVSNDRPAALVLVAPTGLWDDAHPIPDLFALLPYQFAPLLFADAERGASILTGGLDFRDMQAMADFLVANARRLGTAGKILFPIPNRRLATRAYRITAPTLLVWGSADQYHPVVYAERWSALIPHADVVIIDGGAHMIPHEHADRLAAEMGSWVKR